MTHIIRVYFSHLVTLAVVTLVVVTLTVATLAMTMRAAAQQPPSDIIRLLQPATEQFMGRTRHEVLPVDQAFHFEHFPEGAGLKLLWQIRPGYYLYRNKISLMREHQEIAIQLPPGQDRVDEVFGEVQVLEGLVEGLVEASALAELRASELRSSEVSAELTAGELQLSYQGCAESGYCYPPRTRTITLEE